MSAWRKGKVLVAMSGGVDSSVAAAMLLREGYEVVGCFMRLGSPGETLDELMPVSACAARPAKIGHQGCCSINDAADAREVCARLGVPLYVCNFKKDFARIIDYFVDSYASGQTPNPCVRCNDWLKFGKLHEYALSIGAEHVASGHYARVVHDDSGSRLLRAVDHSKDQSYVLFGTPRQRLASMLLPIGGMHKSRVRELARELGLPVHDKPDSQEICFVPDNDYAGLVDARRPEAMRVGQLLTKDGRVLGTHEGQHRFTIGQRRGLGIGSDRRLYVLSKDARTNSVVVGDEADLLVRSCIATESNWLCDAPREGMNLPVFAKYRYNTAAVPAVVRVMSDDTRGTPSGRVGRFEVVFDVRQAAVAPGQAVALFSRGEPDWVMGGGWIESTSSD